MGVLTRNKKFVFPRSILVWFDRDDGWQCTTDTRRVARLTDPGQKVAIFDPREIGEMQFVFEFDNKTPNISEKEL